MSFWDTAWGGLLRMFLLFGGIILAVYILYLAIFKTYGALLRNRYRFRLFNLVGAVMLLISGLYAALHIGGDLLPFKDSAIRFFNGFIFLGSPESAQSAAVSFVAALPFSMADYVYSDMIELVTYALTVFMLVSPLIVVYALYAFIKTRNILHTLLSAFIMTAAAMITGPLGAAIFVFIVMSVVTYYAGQTAIGAMGEQGSSGYSHSKCPVCGGDPSTCGCRRYTE